MIRMRKTNSPPIPTAKNSTGDRVDNDSEGDEKLSRFPQFENSTGDKVDNDSEGVNQSPPDSHISSPCPHGIMTR